MHNVASCGQRSMAMSTYGSDDGDIDEDELKRIGQKKCTTGGTCKCGSATQCTNHSECPLSVKNQRSGVSVDDSI